MGRIRGILLKHRVTTIFRCIFRRHRSPTRYHRLDQRQSCGGNPMTSFMRWTHKLRNKAKAIISCNSKNSVTPRVTGSSGYTQIGQKKQQIGVPKGYMAVYVGQKDGDFQRVLVPVIYFNHPLFGELLRGAEEEFGFNHPGAITLPCRISEFEHVQTRIKQGRTTRKLLTWK